MIGRTLSHYKVLDEISRGGMGIVYKALDLKLNREVALKVLPPELVSDRERKRRFIQEAQAAAALKHPNIAVVYEIDEVDDETFITMELIEGKKLSDILGAGPLPAAQTLGVATEIAEGLKAAHEKGVVHRDLKPGNIMLGKDGHPKIIDFGLAKLVAPLLAEDSEAQTAVRHETEAGQLLGTVAYMSPEQARGRRVDRRTDVFSFGIVLYEMLTGVSPFERGNVADTLSAILNEDRPPVSRTGEGSASSVAKELEAVLDKCLSKNADARYQDTADLVLALKAARDKRHAAEVDINPRTRRFAGLPARIAGTVLLLGTLGFVFTQYLSRRELNSPPVPTKSSLAVLQFQNLTMEPELSWLRTGIPEMLVTDLSQSPEIVIASTARVHESMAANHLSEERALSFDQIQRIAKDVNAQAVVRGSYARLGQDFRISFTVENVENGAILASDRVEGRGEESLFELLDEVSAAIRNRYEIARPAASPPTLAAATTSSLEAWRLYSEGLGLANEFKQAEAVLLLERAIEIDPGFALALADLGGIHSEMGHTRLADEYSRRALELRNRLPLDDRFDIEGAFYGMRWRTVNRAIQVYKEGLQIYPDRGGWRNNLARRYAFLERYDEALAHFDRLIEESSDFSGNYFDAANAHAALGQFQTGYALVSRYASTHTDAWFGHQGLGWFLTEWGKLDDAKKSFEVAEALRPGDWSIRYARWRVATLDEDWQSAEGYAAEVGATNEPMARWRGAVSLARNALYQGRARDALDHFDEAIASYAESNAFTALARCWKAELLLELAEPEQTLEEAELARRAGGGEWPERQALGIAILAHQALGQSSEADALLAELNRLWDGSAAANKVEERHELYIGGLVALSRKDTQLAIQKLRRAASLLPPRGVEFHWHVYPVHVPIWTALGEAELAAGNKDEAISWFARAAESGSEHLEQPVSFVRSFYLLGETYETFGNLERARPYYRRFVDYWKGGDLHRVQVEEAAKKL